MEVFRGPTDYGQYSIYPQLLGLCLNLLEKGDNVARLLAHVEFRSEAGVELH